MPNTNYVNDTNLTSWEINDTEVAKYCISPWGGSGGSLPLYIPKLMPNIPMGKPKTFPVYLNKSCYCNASACRPNVATRLSSQNYITVPPLDNRSFRLPHFWYGDTLQIEVHNKNVDQLFISTKVDNSTIVVE